MLAQSVRESGRMGLQNQQQLPASSWQLPELLDLGRTLVPKPSLHLTCVTCASFSDWIEVCWGLPFCKTKF